MSKPISFQPIPAHNRRELLRAAGVGSLVAGLGFSSVRPVTSQSPVDPPLLEQMVIDLAGVPESIDPALAYSPRDWSIVHSIYDSPLSFASDGTIEPLAAESYAAVDDLTYEIVLRPGLLFHDGSPVTSAAIARSLAHMADSVL